MKRFRMGGDGEVDSISLAHLLVLLSRGGGSSFSAEGGPQQHPERVFECKTCSRRFPSFQALGGHRASHKKPRLPGGDGREGQAQQQEAALARPKVHECSVCGLEFAIGQALGGHMRRHRAAAPAEAFHRAPKGKRGDGGGEKGGVLCLDLDLNLSPPEKEVDFGTLGLGLGLAMVDCFH